MKSGSGSKFRNCNAKYPRLWGALILLGAALIVVSRSIFSHGPEWIAGIGLMMTIAGLLVFVFGTIAARREWKTKREVETK